MKTYQILHIILIIQRLVDSYFVHHCRLAVKKDDAVCKGTAALHVHFQRSHSIYLTAVGTNKDQSNDNAMTNSRYRNPNYYRTNGERLLQMERILSYCKGETDKLKQLPTLTEMNHAITTAGRHNRADDALRIFKAIHQLGYTPDLMSFNNIIWALGNTNRSDAALRIFQELSHSLNLKPNVYTYGALLHGFARTRSYQQAIYYLDEMTRKGVVPNQIVISSVMEACSGAGRYKEALEVMRRMDALGLQPDVTMINTAVKACCVAGAVEEAELLAESLRRREEMDVLTFHTLMMGHTKLARHARVLELYEEALQANIKLDGGIFSLAMLAAFNGQQYGQVKAVAERARRSGVQLTEASYTTLIQAFGELGEADQAVRCLSTMRQEGLVPNEITYSAIMCACRSLPAVVGDLLQRMHRENIKPNTVVLTNAINSLARGGNEYTDKAFALYQDMERNGPEPNIFTYNTIARAFADAGRLEEALHTLKNIDKRQLKPDRYTFTTLLMACGRTNGSDAVDTVMDLMKKAGVAPDLIAYGAALDAHRRAGNSLKAVAVLSEMRANHLEPTAGHYNLIIRTLKAEGHVEKMFKMVMTLSVKAGVKLNSNTFELVIETLLQHSKWKEALLLIRTMDSLGYKPSIGVCVVLVEVLERAREYKAVLALYNYMERKGYDFYENAIINGVFKKLVKVAAGGAKATLNDLNTLHADTDGAAPVATIDAPVDILPTTSKVIQATS